MSIKKKKLTKVEIYREKLRTCSDWTAYLLKESGLPGRRGNIELGKAAALEGDEIFFRHLCRYCPILAPENTPEEFLHFCGVLGYGRLVAGGKMKLLKDIRKRASDPRWRTREAVAMALQTWGKVDMSALIDEMGKWSTGNPLEQRAAAAALCEPVLLTDDSITEKVLDILDRITNSILNTDPEERKTDQFKALRKGMGYCWSVAAAAYPEKGKQPIDMDEFKEIIKKLISA